MKYTLVKRRKSTYAKNHEEFVSWMRKHDVQPWKTNADFMEEYARRKLLFENITLRSGSEDHFVEDLQKNHLLIVEEGSAANFWKLFGR